ncbi:alcohol dehydrogenase catalytic domain-containing protein [Mesorhizobium sp. VK9D]|uniref:alcohol dehydrogenase catalytic domain-containing protein n=1 Tax=Mesorhizobium australafricanum TaxID=3072311 RepID=UPI002A23E649|nr:alcohol dehydrogenase catalytic domain-containing protein [Mesorhizobium sp. VK9D]MDX8452702.1 alcohol dehydrogenase catalytic domain-containing protein [Mesorhizobium sp. VK9D]
MKTFVVRTPGGLDRLEIVERDDPGAPGPGEVRVAIHATSINFHDLLVANGGIPTGDGRVLMADGAGVVEAVGAGVAEFAPGQANSYQDRSAAELARFCDRSFSQIRTFRMTRGNSNSWRNLDRRRRTGDVCFWTMATTPSMTDIGRKAAVPSARETNRYRSKAILTGKDL